MNLNIREKKAIYSFPFLAGCPAASHIAISRTPQPGIPRSGYLL